MAKSKQTEEPTVETPKENPEVEASVEETANPIEKNEVETSKEVATEPSAQVLKLMQLYPQYEEMWITPQGFVHHKNAPKYCTKGAKLYKNKFYKNK